MRTVKFLGSFLNLHHFHNGNFRWFHQNFIESRTWLAYERFQKKENDVLWWMRTLYEDLRINSWFHNTHHSNSDQISSYSVFFSSPSPFYLLSRLLFLLCSRLRPRSRYLRPRLCIWLRPPFCWTVKLTFLIINGNAREACNDQSLRLEYDEKIYENVFFRSKQKRLPLLNDAPLVGTRHIE